MGLPHSLQGRKQNQLFRVRSQRPGDLGKVGVGYEVIEDKMKRDMPWGVLGSAGLLDDGQTFIRKAETSL